jgi:prefoldin subunit 5
MSDSGINLMIEQTITIGNIIEIFSIIGGGLTVLVTLKNTVSNIRDKVDGMQKEIQKLAEVITKMAVTDLRITNLENEVRDLRHGRGFVQKAIDGEYPR